MRDVLERRGHHMFLALFSPLSCRELKGERERVREREEDKQELTLADI
jgi:hypothetical protein